MDLVYMIFSVLYGIYYHRVLATGIVERVYGFMPLKTCKMQGANPSKRASSGQGFPQPPDARAEVEKNRKLALRTIRQKLDVVEISKELIALKAIKHLLFTPKLQELLPLYELKTLHGETAVSENNSLQGQHKSHAKPFSRLFDKKTKSIISSSLNQQHPDRTATSKLRLMKGGLGMDQFLTSPKKSLKKVSDRNESASRASSNTNSTSSSQDILAELRRQIEVKIREELGRIPSETATKEAVS